ncbi:MAG: glycosyltransferase family 9 protein [Lacibacter sp.]
MKILVIQTAFIGDAILATSVLEQLHRHMPAADLHILVRQGNEGLFEQHPYLQRVWVWKKKQHKIWNLLQLAWQIRKAHFDVVINLHRFASSGFITAVSGAPRRIGFQKNPLSCFFTESYPHTISSDASQSLHETGRYQLLLTSFTDTGAARPALYPSAADREAIRPLQGRPYVCMAPASVWFTKQWPVHKWVELCNAIPGEYAIFLLGAPADRALCEHIRQTAQQSQRIQTLCGSLSLLQSAALMQEAVMNFVNDSAPLHLASATNAPVTAIFCSTVPAFGFGPLSDTHYVIETPEKLACRPCGLHGKAACPQQHFRCAESITAEAVLAPWLQQR